LLHTFSRTLVAAAYAAERGIETELWQPISKRLYQCWKNSRCAWWLHESSCCLSSCLDFEKSAKSIITPHVQLSHSRIICFHGLLLQC